VWLVMTIRGIAMGRSLPRRESRMLTWMASTSNFWVEMDLRFNVCVVAWKGGHEGFCKTPQEYRWVHCLEFLSGH